MTLFEVHEVTRRYRRPAHLALDRVSFTVPHGVNLGIVGESGAGKSTLLRLLLALEHPDAGEVRYRGRPLRPGRPGALRWFRREVQLVFQDPAGALNPRLTVHQLITEPLVCLDIGGDHNGRVAQLLAEVGLPQELAARRPGELSGGQRQRVAIARALAPGPGVLVADEPVSSLDVATRMRVLELLGGLADNHDLTLILVSHDLGLVRRLCDQVLVLANGRVVEQGATAEVFTAPSDPYTRSLVAAVPRLPG